MKPSGRAGHVVTLDQYISAIAEKLWRQLNNSTVTLESKSYPPRLIIPGEKKKLFPTPMKHSVTDVEWRAGERGRED